MKKLTALIMAAVLTAGSFSDAALAVEAQGQDEIATEIESQESETDAGISFVDVSKSTGIPILNINLKEVSLSTVNSGEKDEKYPGNTVAITDVDGTVSNYADVELKGRGNTTWLQAKKPYQIKFSSKENLFDLGKSKTYLLLADYLDSTSVRNDATFTIAREMGMAYTNKGTWVDLYVNGSYIGLYYLCHKTKIGSSEVDLSDPKGCLVELDDQKMIEN